MTVHDSDADGGPCTETLVRTGTFPPVSDGRAIDRATEIIKCCPSGSSIRC